MKKIICLLLSAVMLLLFMCPASAFAYEPSYGVYKHVYIIGVDGAGRFFENADTPNFDRIFESGAVKYNAHTETNTNSAQNWGSMLTGVSFFKHGLTNDNTGKTQKMSDVEYPTIFNILRNSRPEVELASFVNWQNINYGIIENDVDVTMGNVKDDKAVADMVCDYINNGNEPTLLFVQFDSVDHIGHDGFGSDSPEFLNQINIVDGYVGQIYDTLNENGLLEDALFIVTADHGHLRQYGGHGGLSMDESVTTIAISGKTVITGGQMDRITRDRDIAAITLYALGVDMPSYFSSRIPSDLFIGVDGTPRFIMKDPLDFITSTLSRTFITSLTDNDFGFNLYAEIVKAVTNIANLF